MSWTTEQEQAIKLNNTNLLVSAAAGSGKTAVLTERIVNKAATDIDIDRMLIITFTKAAASEMRERISNLISSKIDNGDGDINRLINQQALMSKASICTIDSFCKQVVTRNFTISGVDSSFAIGDEEELEVIRQEIFDEMLEEYYLKGEEAFKILADYFSGKSNDVYLRDAIYDVHKFIYTMPDPIEWLRKSIDMYDCNTKEDLVNSVWYKEIINHAITLSLNCKIEAEKAYDLSMSYSAPSVSNVLAEDITAYDNLYEFISESGRSWNEISEYINKFEFKRRSKHSQDVADDVKFVDGLRSDIKSTFNKLKKIFNADEAVLINQVKTLKPIMEIVFKLVCDFDERYSSLKIQRQILSFNDIEHLALKVLRVPEISSMYSKLYSEIYIDEYQDTNMLQEAIIATFSKPDNVFMVGDVKQSIYAFRQACPDLFIDKENRYNKPDCISEDTEGCVIKLSANFRSRRNVVDAVNDIFCKIMNRNTCGVEYFDDDKLYYKATCYKSSEDHVCYKPEIMVCEGGIEDEFNMIGKKINELIKSEMPVYDKSIDGLRPVKYSDIAVLSRKLGNNSNIINKILQSHGIPCYSEEKGGFFEDFDINLILSIVRIIDNPLQDIPLITVLRSPIFNFSEDELARIRINDRNHCFYNSMKTMNNEKIIYFFEKYQEFKEKAKTMSISSFVWMLITETGYYDYVGKSLSGNRRQANLRLLFDRAVAFENSGKRSFFKFINHIEKIMKQESSSQLASVTTEGMDAVAVMTVHKSKGLEFPVVFVSKCSDSLHGKGFNTPSFDINRDLGIAMKLYNNQKDIFEDSFIKKSISIYENRTEIAEEMRILYVAMTRAREKLFVTGTVKEINDFRIKGEIPSDFNVITGKSFLSWIELAADRTYWDVHKELEVEIPEELVEYNSKESPYAPTTERNNFSFEEWSYPYNNVKDLPSKMSVSDIKKRNLDEDNFDYSLEPKMINLFENILIGSSNEVTGAKIGTLLHECLRRVDYIECRNALVNDKSCHEKLKNIFIKLIDKMVENGFVLNDERAIIDPELLVGFFMSETGKRVLDSENVRREVPFTILLDADSIKSGSEGKVTVQGIIDCCFIEGGEYVIVDYKSDNVYGDALKERALSYKTQLDLYAKALSTITGINVKEKILYFLRSNVEFKV